MYLTLIISQHLDILHQSLHQGYVSGTNNITAFGYLAPIRVFGYCFLGNGMESGGYAQRMTIRSIHFGSFDEYNGLWPT